MAALLHKGGQAARDVTVPICYIHMIKHLVATPLWKMCSNPVESIYKMVRIVLIWVPVATCVASTAMCMQS